MHFQHITHRRIGTYNRFPDRDPLCRLCKQTTESSTHLGVAALCAAAAVAIDATPTTNYYNATTTTTTTPKQIIEHWTERTTSPTVKPVDKSACVRARTHRSILESLRCVTVCRSKIAAIRHKRAYAYALRCRNAERMDLDPLTIEFEEEAGNCFRGDPGFHAKHPSDCPRHATILPNCALSLTTSEKPLNDTYLHPGHCDALQWYKCTPSALDQNS
mmetsp:Transcript_24617/g.67665  ORF Transcript_24617/g.67665 Transcript_24617/m.67665 type:complete len:217 (+) Transcript_24617:129-779(+)